MLPLEGFLYIPEIIRTKLISMYHQYLLACHFIIKKNCNLITQKYYQSNLQYNIGAFVKDCKVCLVFKVVYNKSHGNLQSLLVPTHCSRDLSIDFVIGLSISINEKDNNFDSIVIIIDQLMTIVYYESVKVNIDAPRLREVIIDIVIQYYNFFKSIMSN